MNLNTIIGRPKILGWELRTAIEQALPRIVQALDIQPVDVEWLPASTASIDQYGNIRLPIVADDTVIARPLVVRYVGYIVHELLHRKYTNFRVNAQDQYLARMHNAVEDVWIEREAVKSGLLGNIESLLGGLIDGIVSEALAQKIDWTNPAQFPFSFAVFGRQYAARKIPVPHNLLPIYTEANIRIDACKNSADTLAVAQWIIDQIKQQDDNPRDNPQPEGQPDQQGDDQEGTQQGQDGDQGDQGKPQDDQGEGQDGEGQGEGQEGQQDGQGEGQGEGEGQGDTPDAGRSQPMDAPHDTAIEVEPSISKRRGTRGTYCKGQILRDEYHLWGDNRMVLEHAPVSARLTMDIRKLFENTANDDWQMRRKTGSIDTRALAVGGVNMFKRRLENSGVDSSVVILLDVSASMFPRLIKPASEACVALMSALDAAGVESALLTFGDGVSTLKPFSKNSRKAGHTLPRLTDGGGTNDYVGLMHAHSLLHTRKSARKVCFVLTDGEGRTYDTKAQAISGAKLGITTIGVGIQHNVAHVYQHAVCVHTATDLGTAMFSKIKGVL
jgi:uncharacterized protein YegL